MPNGWTPEKEELFLKCSKHARECRERAERAGRRVGPLETEEDRSVFNAMFNQLFEDERVDAALRQHMKEIVERLEWLYAALYPLIGQRVSTPRGTGTLLSVFARQCEVQLDGAAKTFRVSPSEVFLCKAALDAAATGT